MEDDKKVIVRATKDEIALFKQSFLWKDIKRELGLWAKMFEKEMLTVVRDSIDGSKDVGSTLTHLGDIAGRTAAIDYFLSLPDMFLQILEEKKDDSRRNSTD